MAFSRISSVILLAAAVLFNVCIAAPPSLLTPLKRDSDTKFPFGDKKVRGVNLGGWFVLEPWITPSLFEACASDVVDEWTMSEALGPTEMKKRQEKHWSTWITEKDFKDIKKAGLNFVRIPIGYWSVTPIQGDPYVQGAYKYLGKALDWAKKHGIHVMIDLHGAPGSQNGYDNSGHKGPIDWLQGDNVALTYKALNQIRDDHASNEAVAAIELLNEPIGPTLGKNNVKEFYEQGYENLKSHKSIAVGIQGAYEGISGWNNFAKGKKNILLDFHSYQIFKPVFLQMSLAEHIDHAHKLGKLMKKNPSWSINGEFTGAMTDCAKWLNGRGEGARYDNTYEGQDRYYGSCDGKVTGKVSDWSKEYKANIKSFIKAQTTSFEKADGWIFWTWKTESAPEWHFKDLAKAGVFDYLK